MGWWQRLSYKRTAVAFLLTAVAVAVPSGAWYFAARHQVEHGILLRERGIYEGAAKEGWKLAERLAKRLEVLRKSESGRPFYHYQNLFHDPEAAAEGISVGKSPLAHGPADPLIAAHFQVDGEGRLSLPTVNEEFPELSWKEAAPEQCALLDQLNEVAFFCCEKCQAAVDAGGAATLCHAMAGAGSGDADQIEVLPARAWKQHLQANALYADLTYLKKGGALALDRNADRQIEIATSPFGWYTLPVGQQPSLVALRTVTTPAGVWTQGFVVSQDAVEQQLAHSSFPATFASSIELEHRNGPDRVVASVPATPWGVALDVSAHLREALSAAAADRERFFGIFLLGVVAAGVAGGLVVTMMYHSERLAQQRAQFAAAAAHELRTPLAGLRLYGEMLAEGLGNPAKAGDYARRLAGEAERLGRVVTNILSFTRLERESPAVDVQPGDLTAAVRAAAERQRPALEEAGARVELELPEDLPAVRFDRDAVVHIVQNLLDNAEKYTRGIADRTIRLRLIREPAGVVLSVADNGRGIAPKLRRRLFRPFTRGVHQDAPEGLGLGLVLVKLLATAQGGEISYRDGPGGGAEFTVTFPA
ncbi:MAG: HAMP domain-containing histidine kinase [bacterium]|nr:HAMP domain-containing histidine kinase [bacterium]